MNRTLIILTLPCKANHGNNWQKWALMTPIFLNLAATYVIAVRIRGPCYISLTQRDFWRQGPSHLIELLVTQVNILEMLLGLQFRTFWSMHCNGPTRIPHKKQEDNVCSVCTFDQKAIRRHVKVCKWVLRIKNKCQLYWLLTQIDRLVCVCSDNYHNIKSN